MMLEKEEEAERCYIDIDATLSSSSFFGVALFYPPTLYVSSSLFSTNVDAQCTIKRESRVV